MRPDAHHFVRPDWRRFVRPEFQDGHPFALYERKYSQDQPRVPAGDPLGGQWTDEGGDGPSSGSSDRIRTAGLVVKICIVGEKSLFGDNTYKVVYYCADGRQIIREGAGHGFPGIILQPR